VSVSGRLDRRLTPVNTRDELARMVDMFNRMMDRLEDAFAAQRRFVADASHELRTPLTTIRGNLDLLRRSGVVSHPDMQEALGDVAAEAERMSRLVDGLLALARADAGRQLARVPVRLDRLVREVRREIQPLTQDVRVSIGTLERAEVQGDPDALKQLILILADNGIKYTAPGGAVTMDLQFDRDDAVLTVCDTGSGIAPADLPHIFERFYRAASVRGSGGTGLGLAIARWIADRHGAQVTVESTVGVGTTFEIRMPAARLATPVREEVLPLTAEAATSA
jgi:signal transduction histidine kinase